MIKLFNSISDNICSYWWYKWCNSINSKSCPWRKRKRVTKKRISPKNISLLNPKNFVCWHYCVIWKKKTLPKSSIHRFDRSVFLAMNFNYIFVSHMLRFVPSFLNISINFSKFAPRGPLWEGTWDPCRIFANKIVYKNSMKVYLLTLQPI